MRPARLIDHRKFNVAAGLIVEIKIWELPRPTKEWPHGYKYSLFFGGAKGRVVGYDNETGKGDHRHYRQREEPYVFTTLRSLIDDFLADV